MTPELQQLETLRNEFKRGISAKKRVLLDRLEQIPLKTDEEIVRLHDLLCFMGAYPDDRSVRSRVDRMLDNFSEREDLQDFAEDLVNSGIAGTEVHFSFYWFTLCRLAERWPNLLSIDWTEFRGRQRAMLDRRLGVTERQKRPVRNP